MQECPSVTSEQQEFEELDPDLVGGPYYPLAGTLGDSVGAVDWWQTKAFMEWDVDRCAEVAATMPEESVPVVNLDGIEFSPNDKFYYISVCRSCGRHHCICVPEEKEIGRMCRDKWPFKWTACECGHRFLTVLFADEHGTDPEMGQCEVTPCPTCGEETLESPHDPGFVWHGYTDGEYWHRNSFSDGLICNKDPGFCTTCIPNERTRPLSLIPAEKRMPSS
jgi:hypothetical protein